MGEALVAFELREALYQAAAKLPEADALAAARDELGRKVRGSRVSSGASVKS